MLAFFQYCGDYADDFPFTFEFLKQCFKNEKSLIPMAKLKFFQGNFPGYRELSARNLWLAIQQEEELLKYFPKKYCQSNTQVSFRFSHFNNLDSTKEVYNTGSQQLP